MREPDALILSLHEKVKEHRLPEVKKAVGHITRLPYFIMVDDVGLEPTASGSGDQRSIQLS